MVVHGFQPRQAHGAIGGLCRNRSRRKTGDGIADGGDIFRRSAATAAHHVKQTFLCIAAQDIGHEFCAVGIARGAERVGQASIRVHAHRAICQSGQLTRKGQHEVCPQCTIHADGQRRSVAHGVPERLHGLPGQRAAGAVSHGETNHERRQLSFLSQLLNGVDTRLRIKRVENRLQHQHIHPAVGKRLHLSTVGTAQLVKVHRAETGVIHLRRKGCCHGHRPDGTAHQTGAPLLLLRSLRCLTRHAAGRQIHLPHQSRQRSILQHAFIIVLIMAAGGLMVKELMLPQSGGGESAGAHHV